MKGEVPVASESTAAVAVKDARRGKVLYLWPARGLETAVQEASGSKEGAREAMAEEEKGKRWVIARPADCTWVPRVLAFPKQPWWRRLWRRFRALRLV